MTTPIGQTSHGMIVFLDCGCAGWRHLTHPTGEAVLVEVIEPCRAHASERIRFCSVRKEATVSPWVRSLVHIDPIRAQ